MLSFALWRWVEKNVQELLSVEEVVEGLKFSEGGRGFFLGVGVCCFCCCCCFFFFFLLPFGFLGFERFCFFYVLSWIWYWWVRWFVGEVVVCWCLNGKGKRLGGSFYQADVLVFWFVGNDENCGRMAGQFGGGDGEDYGVVRTISVHCH